MSKRSAGHRYARALFDVAVKEHDNLDLVERELADFVDLLAKHPALEKVLLNPSVPAARKRATVAAVSPMLTPVVHKLLLLMAERDRLVILPDLLASFRERVLDHKNVVRAEVVTAFPLSLEQAAAIKHSLTEVSGRTVMLSTRVDPTIVGGLVAQIGGTVYDASVTSQLRRMKQRLFDSL